MGRTRADGPDAHGRERTDGREGGRARREPDRHAVSEPSHPLLELQRHAGNAAVAASMRQANGPTLARAVYPEYKQHWTDGLALGLLSQGEVRHAREHVHALGRGAPADLEVKKFVTRPQARGALAGLRRLVSASAKTSESAQAWRSLLETSFDVAKARDHLRAGPAAKQPDARERRRLTEAYSATIFDRVASTGAGEARAFGVFWAESDAPMRWAVLRRVVPEVEGLGLRPVRYVHYILESVDPKRRHNSFWSQSYGDRMMPLVEYWAAQRRGRQSLFDFADRLTDVPADIQGKTTERQSSEERLRYAVRFRGSTMVRTSGQLLNDGAYLFVLAADGLFYVAPEKEGRHHSSFTGGRAVQSGGTLIVKASRIAVLSDQSGHYRPTPAELVTAVRFLERQGVDLKTVMVGQEGVKHDVPGEEFLVRQTRNAN
jgi:hypothetical protein